MPDTIKITHIEKYRALKFDKFVDTRISYCSFLFSFFLSTVQRLPKKSKVQKPVFCFSSLSQNSISIFVITRLCLLCRVVVVFGRKSPRFPPGRHYRGRLPGVRLWPASWSAGGATPGRVRFLRENQRQRRGLAERKGSGRQGGRSFGGGNLTVARPHP